jgi:hypothetical protein
MNERIQELAEKAEEYAFDELFKLQGPVVMSISRRVFEQSFREKFAELLIQECAKIVKDSTWNLPHGYKAVDQANLVKQHFGVE